MAKRQPQRTCIACRTTSTKRELIRIVRTAEGSVAVDPTGKRSGRGAYLCADPECWRIALEQRCIGHALRMTPGSDDIALLEAYADELAEQLAEEAGEA